jgi:hypothetical protein
MIGVLEFDTRWGLEIFLFTTVSRTALGPTQPPIQWGKSGRGVKLTTHLHIVPRSRTCGAIPSLPHSALHDAFRIIVEIIDHKLITSSARLLTYVKAYESE